METELTCPVCLELFRKPVVLPCSHNLCTPCAQKILEPDGTPKVWIQWVNEKRSSDYKSHLEPNVKCPTCRRKFPVDPRGVEALSRNLILENIIERFKEERTTAGTNPKNPLLCQFCEDVTPQKASIMCTECDFMYCGTCFDTCHPSKGPLANHTVGAPVLKPPKRSENELKCVEHKKEKLALYCLMCRAAVCYMCKEYGNHKGHEVELLDAVFNKVKAELARTLGTLIRKNASSQKHLETLEGMCTIAKKSGNDVETHVKHECDALVAIIEKRKADLLNTINAEYQDKLDELRALIDKYEHTLQQSAGLVEFTQEALKEESPGTFLQTCDVLKTRLGLMCDAIGILQPALSVVPTFDHMAVDTSWERKALKKLSWLHRPGSPTFDLNQCKVMNRSVHLQWISPQSAVDSYDLELESTTPSRDLGEPGHQEVLHVSPGTSCTYTLEFPSYGTKVTARVRATNRAGEGPFSDDVVLFTEKGLIFRLDPSTCPQRELVFSRDLTVARLTSTQCCRVLGDAPLSTGRHYWKVKIDQFSAANHNGFITVGVCKKGDPEGKPLGDDGDSFALQVFENTTLWCENTPRRLQVKQKATHIKGSNVAVLLDMDQFTMNIYLNGKLQTDDNRPGGPSLVGLTGPLYPALSMCGTSIQMSVQTGLKLPTRSPARPVISLEDCRVDNTTITLIWYPPDKCNIDCYIVEVDILDREGDIHQERNFRKAYQGPRSKYTLRGLEYNKTVLARVKALNTAGESEPSEEVSLSTEKGAIFKLVSASAHESLRLYRGDRSVKQNTLIHANVFGEALLADGCHFWRVTVDSFKGDNAFFAVGVARQPTQAIILGNDSNSYAVQVFQGTTARGVDSSKNKIQIRRKAIELKDSSLGVLLNLHRHYLNIYLDGELLTGIGHPKGPSFGGVNGTFCAGLCLYGTDVGMSLVTGIATPTSPDPPAFNKVKCKVKNTAVFLGWVAPESKCCIDYYVVEVDMIKTSEFASRKRKDRKFKRVYEGPSHEFALYSVPYSVKVVARVLGTNLAGDGIPSDELVLATPKGLYFQLDPSTTNSDLHLSNDNCTVSLKSPMYAFILGNVKLSTGCHYWRVHIDEFCSQNKLSIIGIGIARGNIEDPILGEDSDSYAVQINEHPNATCINTKNRVQIKKTSPEIVHSNMGVLLNLDENLLNVYLNGKLVTDSSRPLGPTFPSITGEFYPALSLYGTNVKLTVHTGEAHDELA